MNRSDTIDRIRRRKQPWDVIVIGGGATGVGCALDAASRGFDVLLLEKNDLGKGTSSRSTKLIHGGVRYLRQGNLSLVREALHERALLLKNAPHVVREQAFVIPCYSLWQKLVYTVGLKFYDLLAAQKTFGKSQILSRRDVVKLLPNIEAEGLLGGVQYFDGQFDDTRLLIDMAVSATEHGAAILNYARVTGFEFNENGQIDGVEVADAENGEKFSVRSKCVINAAGAFGDMVRQLSDASVEPVLTYSQGIHLVFDRKFLPSNAALLIPKTPDGRVLFCIPWLDRVLVGTTDTPTPGPIAEPKALEAEIDFVLDTVGRYLTKRPTRGDVLSVFAGIRPLVNPGTANKTSSISRGHYLFTDRSGMVTIAGGKWTTYRKMAEDAVDMAILLAALPERPCITASLPIKPPKPGMNGERLHPAFPYTHGDITRAVNREMARTVEDVLARRTRILFLDAQAAIELAPLVARIVDKELGLKDKEWVDSQVREFRGTANAYLCR